MTTQYPHPEGQIVNSAAILFDQWAALGKGETMAQGHWPMTRQILEKMALRNGYHCLDIGCGNGYAVRAMAERVAPDGKAFGLDIAPLMVQAAQASPQNPQNVVFKQGTAECLPFESDTLDRLLSVEALYYMPDPLQCLQEWHRVLKAEQGSAWIMVDFYQENRYSHCWADYLGLPMHLYSEAEYQALFEKAEFQYVNTTRLFNMEPLSPAYEASFQPAWGYTSLDDVIDFRTRIGSLLVWGTASHA